MWQMQNISLVDLKLDAQNSYLVSQAKIYHYTRGNEKREQYDAPKYYSQWNHPADALEMK